MEIRGIDNPLFLCVLIGSFWVAELRTDNAKKHIKVCTGTSNGLSLSGDDNFRYKTLKSRYENCTHVDGNLEINDLYNTSFDLSFLESIQEVSGYVLIKLVYTHYIPLTNLRIIRGKERFPLKNEGYSLFVALNYRRNSLTEGLLQIGFKSLTEISRGKISFNKNILLCFHDSIDWVDVNPNVYQPVEYHHYNESDITKPRCPDCDPSCYNPETKQRHCWGPGPDKCQTLNKKVCSRRCFGRCFGKKSFECCHPQCAAGCDGPRSTDCFACKHVMNNGRCVKRCPRGRYVHSFMCVDNCPGKLLKDSSLRRCVRSCKDYEEIVDGVCIASRYPPKVCKGTEDGLAKSGNQQVRFELLKNRYENCTHVDGNLEINDAYYPESDLSFLESIEEVSGYVLISSMFVNSIPLKSLKIIRGKELFRFKNQDYSLFVILNVSPNSKSEGLLELGFRRLTEISRGKVYFKDNDLLCHHTTINWEALNPNQINPVQFDSTSHHRRECPRCHPLCFDENTLKFSCWGEGPNMCQRFNNKVACSDRCPGRCFGPIHDECCHHECVAGCTGPRRTDCYACKNFNDNGKCVKRCPRGKIPNGPFCINACPDGMIQNKDLNTCVKACKKGEYIKKGQCVEDVTQQRKVCQGTSNRLSITADERHRYEKLRRLYENCTHVEGNLEIKDIYNSSFDLSFLESIQEVSGYVLITSIFLNEIPLTNLRIIRGKERFSYHHEGYSLFVALNYRPNSTEDGLLRLGFKSLSEISRGKILFHSNKLLCFQDTIQWEDMNPYLSRLVDYRGSSKNQSECPQCHPSCYNPDTNQSYCWGEGKKMCQRLNKIVCNRKCRGRCYGKRKQKCCHPQCAAGCNGPRPTDCFACKNVMHNGRCVKRCPRGKYEYGTACVDDCPDNQLKDSSLTSCVRSCKKYEESKDGACVKLGYPHKVCKGTDIGFTKSGDENDRYRRLRRRYENCTHVDGSLEINFLTDPDFDLSFLESIEEISGYVMITSVFVSTIPLRNLKIIRGKQLFPFKNQNYSLFVVLNSPADSSPGGLLQLGFRRLTEITRGEIYFYLNNDLCYHRTINWRALNPSLALPVHYGNKTEEQRKCPRCHQLCFNADTKNFSCWGEGPTMCQQFNSKEACSPECPGRCYGTIHDECCHPECAAGCNGPRRTDCYACKNFNDDGKCVKDCPRGKTAYGPFCIPLFPDKIQ